MTEVRQYDALFVINQNCDLMALTRLCRENGYLRVFFLTTHAFLENEVDSLREELPEEPFIRTFSEFLTDGEMEHCDEVATKELLAIYDGKESRDDYFNRFIELSLLKKNRTVMNHLMEKCRFNNSFFAEGLGIDASTWSGAGGKPLKPPVVPGHARWLVARITAIASRLCSLFQNYEFHLIADGTVHFIFLSSVRRLRFNRVPEKLRFRPIMELLRHPFRLTREGLIDAFLSSLEKRIGHRMIIATTIHGYEGCMSRLGRNLRIFVDGYHPSNYPRCYLDGYAVDDFVVRTMLDKKWFVKYGKTVFKPCSFLHSEFFREIDETIEIGTVVLLLNHAGDWTALISRSDTDLLIRQFADAASSFPKTRFVIRPHPTMTHPRHEGVDSIERIRIFVDWTKLENLEVSSVPLGEDFLRGGLFVSEYSQTLLDVYRMGKPGLIANCSGRRSFMADYEELGFPAMVPEEELKESLCRIFADPMQHVAMQNRAVRLYNEALKRFICDKEQVCPAGS